DVVDELVDGHVSSSCFGRVHEPQGFVVGQRFVAGRRLMFARRRGDAEEKGEEIYPFAYASARSASLMFYVMNSLRRFRGCG
ncbi:MAG TPA: hypothetical protein VF695_13755, partial [Sphingomonas sp.]